MTSIRVRLALCAFGATLLAASAASAQVFGTFPWQMQPYCNVVTLTLTSTPAGFTLDGTDNQCGGVNTSSAVGVASFNASGLVNVNFTVVTAPSGKAIHVAAVVSPADGNGTWTDSVGNSGTFVLAGAVPGLPPRPMPTSGLGASVITTTEIAAGAVGGSDIDTTEVQARVTGTCTAGQAVSAVNADGTVTCAATDVAVQFRAVGQPAIPAPTSTVVASTWNTPQYNIGGGTYTAAAGTYAVPIEGLYLVTTSVRWTDFAAASGRVCVHIQVNASNVGSPACAEVTTTAGFHVQQTSTVLSLAAGAAVRVIGFHNSGAATTFGSVSSGDAHFSVTRIR